MRGKGRVFKRGAVPWIAYCLHGKEIRESAADAIAQTAAKRRRELTTAEAKLVAQRLLETRLREVANDREGIKAFVGPQQDRLTVGQLLDALESDLKLRHLKSLGQTLGHLRIVGQYFGDLKAVNVGPETVTKYIAKRLAEGQKAATINRRTTLLGQAFRLAVRRRQISSMPEIPKLRENNVRRGFFEKTEIEALLNHLPEYLKGFVQFGSFCGWRKSGIASLEWADVDMTARVIRLRPEHSKNDHGSVLALEGDLWEIIARQWASRECDKPDGTIGISALVFHRQGQPVGDIRKSWGPACVKAGLGRFVKEPSGKLRYEGKLFHDLRRTAVRNMNRAGVPERVSMEVTGHKTRSVFDRYNIVSEADLRDAMQRTQAYLAAAPKQAVVTPFPAADQPTQKVAKS
jgi:integrase